MLEAILCVLIGAALCRMSGGGLGAKYLNKKGKEEGIMPINLSSLPEICLSALVGGIGAVYLGNLIGIEPWVVALFTSAWFYAWFQTGHGAILHWGLEKVTEPDRRQTLTPVVDYIALVLGVEKNSTNYCRLFMAVKGLLIGLPILAFPLIVLWPLAYEVGARLRGKIKFDPHAAAELLSGAFLGFCVSLLI